MDDADPPPLAYAVSEPAVERWRQVRRIVGWFAVAYGGLELLTTPMYLWPGGLRFGSVLWLYYLTASIRSVAAIPLVVGGAMALNRRDFGWVVVRAASLTTLIALTIGAVAVPLNNPPSAGTSTLRFGALLARLVPSLAFALASVPALLFLLSFPLRREPAQTGG